MGFHAPSVDDFFPPPLSLVQLPDSFSNFQRKFLFVRPRVLSSCWGGSGRPRQGRRIESPLARESSTPFLAGRPFLSACHCASGFVRNHFRSRVTPAFLVKRSK